MFPYFIAKKWLGGRTVEEAVKYAESVHSKKIISMVDYLGEHYHSISQVEDSVQNYLKLIDLLHSKKINSSLSLKLTQFGLDIDEDTCLEHFKAVVAKANEKNIFVWVDMESSDYTERIISIFEEELDDFKQIGIALQANLKRTDNDLERLVGDGAIVRIVKGAYMESESVSFQTKKEVEHQFSRHIDFLFDHTKKFALATHDEKFIQYGIQLLNSEMDQSKIEFQLLKGKKPGLEEGLVKQGLRVAEYIPFGSNFSPFVWRRIKELERNLF